MKKILVISSLLLINNASAQTCIPKPDCTDMGYTDTSCEGTSIKCPFDTTKMICLSELIKKGSQNCTAGMIYYSDKSCSSTYDSSKTPIGVVVKDNELVLSQINYSRWWSNDNVDTSLYNLSEERAKIDYSGKTNVKVIIEEDSEAEAVTYCNDYTTAGTIGGDWYLPAAGELYRYVYGNYSIINTAMTAMGWRWGWNNYLWSSSEIGHDSAWIVEINSNSSYLVTGYKNNSAGVGCFLEI